MSLVYTQRGANAGAVIALVHGLDGHWAKHWGTFPARLACDLPGVSVAAFDYRSDLQGFVADPARTLEGEARRLSKALSFLLTHHRSVAIVGHCLGGLMATLALRPILVEEGVEPGRITLFLLDTPHDLPGAGPSDWLAGLLRVLKFSPSAFRRNASFWDRTWAADEEQTPVNAYAVASQGESWVTCLTPNANLPRHKVYRVPLSHTELVRVPRAGAFPTYDFVLARLRELF